MIESKGDAVRVGTKLWWYSSNRAWTIVSSRAAMNQFRVRNSRDELTNARPANQPSTAYSVKCAAFRTRKCAIRILSSVKFGNSQRRSGRTTLEVFTAENSPVDAKEINAIQSKSGA